jgi:hypothetical protein
MRKLPEWIGKTDNTAIPARVKIRLINGGGNREAFESMSQDEASRFFNLAVAYVLNEFGPWVQDHPDWSEVRKIIEHATQGQATCPKP